MLEQERRRAEEEAARLEAERQAALLAKEELARQAENQLKTQEQLVSAYKMSSFALKLKTAHFSVKMLDLLTIKYIYLFERIFAPGPSLVKPLCGRFKATKWPQSQRKDHGLLLTNHCAFSADLWDKYCFIASL